MRNDRRGRAPRFPAERLYGKNTPVFQGECDSNDLRPETESCVIMQYEIFPGVCLTFHDIHTDHMDYSEAPMQFPPDMISIQHCREGRFEGEYQNGECFYLGQGDLSVNLPAHSPSKNAFPLSHYHGVNIVVFPEPAAASIQALEQVLGPLDNDL